MAPTARYRARLATEEGEKAVIVNPRFPLFAITRHGNLRTGFAVFFAGFGDQTNCVADLG